MEKDWTGNSKTTYSILGASNHSEKDREENDYYATSPRAVEMLLEKEQFSDKIWECAAGGEHISKVLVNAGKIVWNTDIIDRTGNIEVLDFLTSNVKWDGDIITNPPYKYAQEFVEKAMESITEGHKVAMYLKLTFLETAKRRELFRKYPPKYVYVSSRRLGCAPNGQFSDMENETEAGAVCYAWFVWEKGFLGEPTIRWFNDK